jgi:hypothetical protein
MGLFTHTSQASCCNTSLLYFNCMIRTIQSVLLFPVLKCHMRDTHWNNVWYLCEKWVCKKSRFQDITIPNNELFIWIVYKLRLTGSLMDKSNMKNKIFCEKLIAHFPLIRHRLHTKRWIQQLFYCCMCICCCCNVFTELLPSNDRGTQIQTDGMDLWSTLLKWALVPL